MSENMLTTTAAQMAWFLAGSWAIAAGETAKPRVLYALNPVDREILAFETLGLIAEGQDGFVSEADIVEAAWHWAIADEEVVPMATDLYHALRDCQ